MKAEVAKREIESLDYYLQNHTDDYSEASHTAMMMAISALSENKGEYIKRGDAIDEFKAQKDAWEYYGESFYNEKYIRFDDVINTICELPAVAFPKENKGEWKIHDLLRHLYRCSECQTLTQTRFYFCPNCGAKMEEVSE